MKYLSQFVKFDAERFFDGKVLMVTGVKKWQDFESKADLGTKVETVIIKDDTHYTHKNGETGTNRFEKLTLKIAQPVSIPLNTYVLPKGVKATIYGEFRNQLSVTCDEIQTVQTK